MQARSAQPTQLNINGDPSPFELSRDEDGFPVANVRDATYQLTAEQVEAIKKSVGEAKALVSSPKPNLLDVLEAHKRLVEALTYDPLGPALIYNLKCFEVLCKTIPSWLTENDRQLIARNISNLLEERRKPQPQDLVVVVDFLAEHGSLLDYAVRNEFLNKLETFSLDQIFADKLKILKVKLLAEILVNSDAGQSKNAQVELAVLAQQSDLPKECLQIAKFHLARKRLIYDRDLDVKNAATRELVEIANDEADPKLKNYCLNLALAYDIRGRLGSRSYIGNALLSDLTNENERKLIKTALKLGYYVGFTTELLNRRRLLTVTLIDSSASPVCIYCDLSIGVPRLGNYARSIDFFKPEIQPHLTQLSCQTSAQVSVLDDAQRKKCIAKITEACVKYAGSSSDNNIAQKQHNAYKLLVFNAHHFNSLLGGIARVHRGGVVDQVLPKVLLEGQSRIVLAPSNSIEPGAEDLITLGCNGYQIDMYQGGRILASAKSILSLRDALKRVFDSLRD